MPGDTPASPRQLMADIEFLAAQLRRAARRLPQAEYEAVANKAIFQIVQRAHQAGVAQGDHVASAASNLPELRVLAGVINGGRP